MSAITDIRFEPPRAFALAESVFSVDEAAEHLRISRSAFYRLVAAGKIKTAKIGARTIVAGSELARYVAALAA
jgi:excisionase family DNA binding protein